jgi:diguanylate cyclase (GGDEF)-like protein
MRLGSATKSGRCRYAVTVGSDEPRGGIGWQRILALGLLLGTVAAVASLQAFLGGAVDLSLLYFAVVLGGALFFPFPIAIALAAGTALVSVYVSRVSDSQLLVSFVARLILYGYAALLTNNWERERRKLARLTRVDELTGLYNLRALREQIPVWLGPAARSGRPMAVMMLDLDGFKVVNDRLGHQVGNDVLRRASDVLRVCSRIGDPVFRYGGDEFVILLSDTAAEGADTVARRITQALQQLRPSLADERIGVSFSIGIAIFPADGDSADLLIAHADEALYRAKAKGGGATVHWSEPAETAA